MQVLMCVALYKKTAHKKKYLVKFCDLPVLGGDWLNCRGSGIFSLMFFLMKDCCGMLSCVLL